MGREKQDAAPRAGTIFAVLAALALLTGAGSAGAQDTDNGIVDEDNGRLCDCRIEDTGDPVIGVVEDVNGDTVWISYPSGVPGSGGPLPAAPNMDIYIGTNVTTGAGSSTLIYFLVNGEKKCELLIPEFSDVTIEADNGDVCIKVIPSQSPTPPPTAPREASNGAGAGLIGLTTIGGPLLLLKFMDRNENNGDSP